MYESDKVAEEEKKLQCRDALRESKVGGDRLILHCHGAIKTTSGIKTQTKRNQ